MRREPPGPQGEGARAPAPVRRGRGEVQAGGRRRPRFRRDPRRAGVLSDHRAGGRLRRELVAPAPGRPRAAQPAGPLHSRRPRARRRPAATRSRARTPCAPARRQGNELLVRRRSREDVAVRDRAHRDVGDDRPPVRARDRDRERIRPGQRLAALGMRQPRRRRRRQRRDQAALGELAHPVPEHPGREAVARRRPHGPWPAGPRAARGRLRPGSGSRGRRARPSARTRARRGSSRGVHRVEIRERRQPLDPRQAVPAASARLGVEKVIGENARVHPEKPSPPSVARTSSRVLITKSLREHPKSSRRSEIFFREQRKGSTACAV